MEALLMLAVITAVIAAGAFRKDRYDEPGSNGSLGKHTSLRNRYRSIDDYDRHALNHTQKQR